MNFPHSAKKANGSAPSLNSWFCAVPEHALPPKPRKARLDQMLVDRRLADSLSKAQALILAGEVSVDEVRIDKPGTSISESAQISVSRRTPKFASRAGQKLEGALDDFSINAASKACLDIGASTGGFTDCLLQRGAARVWAVDVNIGQLAWKLQQDQRVIKIERNARELQAKEIAEPIDLAVIDVSFISATKVIVPAANALKPNADLLVLVKPQFELSKQDIPTGGVVSDQALHQKAVEKVRMAAAGAKLEVLAVAASRLPGAEGNLEYFLHTRKVKA
jgi:23S rRNA (cytidine1920-2'-O)/16S rRNA (cytidine1409-2'-O)-methyltransferase